MLFQESKVNPGQLLRITEEQRVVREFTTEGFVSALGKPHKLSESDS